MNDPNPPAGTPGQQPRLTCPDPPGLPPRVILVMTLQSAVDDLTDLLTHREPSARMLDRLSEEVAEAASMARALPGRPPSMSGHDTQLLAALRSAHAAGEDVAEAIARGLARLAAELGGSTKVLANRPGSWEAAHVAELLRGTLGPDDEDLPMYGIGGAGGSL